MVSEAAFSCSCVRRRTQAASAPSGPEGMDAGAPLPLAGTRVLDFSHALAGPYCTMLLGDFGADVIKVEPPHGDHSRQWGPPFIKGESSYFLSVNRNKRSVVLDLKNPAAVLVAEALAMASDVVVEHFKPGTMARLGVNATPEGPPTKVGVPIGDITAGMFASNAILAALVERASTGKGRRIDVALNDSLLALFTYQAGRFFATGEVPRQEGNHHATISPYGTFAVSDGFINVAVATDAQYLRFCEAIRAPELSDDPRFATNALRQEGRPELVRAIEAHLTDGTRKEWLARVEQFGIPAGPILDIEEAFASPLATARHMRVEIEHPKACLLYTSPS